MKGVKYNFQSISSTASPLGMNMAIFGFPMMGKKSTTEYLLIFPFVLTVNGAQPKKYLLIVK